MDVGLAGTSVRSGLSASFVVCGGVVAEVASDECAVVPSVGGFDVEGVVAVRAGDGVVARCVVWGDWVAFVFCYPGHAGVVC